MWLNTWPEILRQWQTLSCACAFLSWNCHRSEMKLEWLRFFRKNKVYNWSYGCIFSDEMVRQLNEIDQEAFISHKIKKRKKKFYFSEERMLCFLRPNCKTRIWYNSIQPTHTQTHIHTHKTFVNTLLWSSCFSCFFFFTSFPSSAVLC